ncbi:PP-loop family-domain-containing protein [Ampelomyces quisqualis]|uniref:tRNA(Ile)-lysidine synthetase n=1 Tax=Ampelomyces quisqualis TaxID=50730 RepID=A0A6A5QHG8_AMPQU|nr:PP-loop family-domain-containing protein [Ampelomyces quisqualis]
MYMWSSNVLRLRKWSSTGRLNHGVISRRYSSQKSLPITELEFEDALSHVLPFRKSTDGRKRPLGFAVSGGVDSMALVSLYARARQTHVHLAQAHGFIVDHKVRPESTEEAEWVAEQLRSKYSMDASILTLAWPTQFDMLDIKRFESEARALRYQALGRACRDHGINSLMVAHHGDDQAETVMMRLAKSRLRSGLKGMRSTEWIPECEGIYGVYHSGQRQKTRPPSIPFPVEQGGIRILRPLLAMEKSRLIATCEERGVQWIEDKSNRIQSLTSRNAIRHIYQNHKLPEALSINSLVNLSLHMQKRIEAHKAYADSLYDQCLLKLNIRYGTLIVRFPPFSKLLARPIKTEADKNEARNNATYLLGRVAELVTARTMPALGQISERIDSIYPEFLSAKERDAIVAAGEGHFKENFTVCRLWWRRWLKASPFEDDALPADDFGASAPHPQEWLLTRQSLDLGESNTLQLAIPPSLPGGPDSKFPESKEDYKLFDGRYWIELRNYTNDTLVIRPLRKGDIQGLPTARNEEEGGVFNRIPGGYFPERFMVAALSLIKPYDVRFTLPAVFRRDDAGRHSLIGLPTLNVGIGGLGPPQGICDWRVRYKKIDFGQHTVKDMIVPGRDLLEIIEEVKRLRHANKGVLHFNFGGNYAPGEEKAGVGAEYGFKRLSVQPRPERNTPRPMLGEESEDSEVLQDTWPKPKGNLKWTMRRGDGKG